MTYVVTTTPTVLSAAVSAASHGLLVHAPANVSTRSTRPLKPSAVCVSFVCIMSFAFNTVQAVHVACIGGVWARDMIWALRRGKRTNASV